MKLTEKSAQQLLDVKYKLNQLEVFYKYLDEKKGYYSPKEWFINKITFGFLHNRNSAYQNERIDCIHDNKLKEHIAGAFNKRITELKKELGDLTS